MMDRRRVPKAKPPRNLSARIPSLAAQIRPAAIAKPPKLETAPLPPPPPPVELAKGVAATLPRPSFALPPKPKVGLPGPPVVPHPVGLAGRIPPLPKRVLRGKR